MFTIIANALGINRAFVWIGAAVLAGAVWGAYAFIKHRGADEVASASLSGTIVYFWDVFIRALRGI
ncbi:hypothetical protein [Nitratireductor luteus]|uniref:hypothetical protein n=1 Tax=Nitratireductor luteus TaxID=2976980 RepID=UPI00224045F8|nr:hypothetical protein [Nitratireductor luteus]